MKNMRRLLWVIALFPWFDFVIRRTLPSFVGSTWDDLLLLALLGMLVLYKRHERRYEVIPRSVEWSFLVFAFCSVVSIIIHVVPLAVSIDALRVIFQPMLFAAATMYLVDDEETLDIFLRVLVISTVVIAAFGIVQYILKLDLGLWKHTKDTEQFRITSIFSNPNALGSYFNMVLAFTLSSILLRGDLKEKLLYLAASGMIGVALLLTFSRSAMIAFVIMVMYFIFVWNKKWLLAFPVLAAGAPFILPPGVISRFKNLLDPAYYRMASEYGRLSFWSIAVEKIKENPLAGVGLGTFGDSVALRHNIPFATWVDNHYLKIGAEIGIPGLLAFLALLLALFILAHKLYRRSDTGERRMYALGIAGVVITMSVQNVTASILESLANAIYFYSFIGILFAMLSQFGKAPASTGEHMEQGSQRNFDLSLRGT